MACIINASTSAGLVQSADTSGILQLQSNGTTELTVQSTGVTVADNLLFNSGYGSAVIGYGCRAWVNFNGTGTVAIRGSGNVTSITDNGTGDYTINFTTAMPDVNYAWSASCGYGTTAASDGIMVSLYGAFATYQLVGSVRILTTDPSAATSGQAFDAVYVGFNLFR